MNALMMRSLNTTATRHNAKTSLNLKAESEKPGSEITLAAAAVKMHQKAFCNKSACAHTHMLVNTMMLYNLGKNALHG